MNYYKKVKGEVNYDSAMWEAKAYTPQGIIEGVETKELLLKDDYVETIPYQWNGLNNKLGGIRKGELVLLTAGSQVQVKITSL